MSNVSVLWDSVADQKAKATALVAAATTLTVAQSTIVTLSDRFVVPEAVAAEAEVDYSPCPACE